jgi:hypothetical protein
MSSIFYNPYFSQIVNPAYVDIIDCPYLNYEKNTLNYEKTSEHIDKEDKIMTLPEENVSGFINSLKHDWDTLSPDVKQEYNDKLKTLINESHETEHLKSYDNNYLFIFLILVILIICVLCCCN